MTGMPPAAAPATDRAGTAIVQVLEGTAGMDPSATRAAFSGSPLTHSRRAAAAGPGAMAVATEDELGLDQLKHAARGG